MLILNNQHFYNATSLPLLTKTLTHTCTVEAVHFTHLFRRIESLLWDCDLYTDADAHLFAQDSGLPFFDRGLNAAAGSEEAELPFGWPRLPATTESLTMSKFIRVLILLLV